MSLFSVLRTYVNNFSVLSWWLLCSGLIFTAAGRILRAHMNDQEQWNKLHHYLDQRFDAIDDRFARMDERFDAIDERLDLVEERLGGIESTVDAIYGRLENVETNQTATKAQLDLHERWHHSTAGNLGR
ncbi:MAG: hypothetical protein LC799_24200 [Actinobacteria bacterium]|nr:hypothetical protein [Actinomycetota bacterium]